ncbi:hypothetical protein AX774_g7033 [Zancudomyces culisetae]|uniref:Uncharacterized protein n=1 Tax=Zancudomyces culisetae TaxID=1213189 RepID=A0A1R1PF03_ZANCU|nr:hypothetical protein AX774_g7033 [Zancudomyces culisetae]|eukprot:OMH79547.1 hypothetical protein AX774_g7033 [Zancudomyces culisetae]
MHKFKKRPLLMALNSSPSSIVVSSIAKSVRGHTCKSPERKPHTSLLGVHGCLLSREIERGIVTTAGNKDFKVVSMFWIATLWLSSEPTPNEDGTAAGAWILFALGSSGIPVRFMVSFPAFSALVFL